MEGFAVRLNNEVFTDVDSLVEWMTERAGILVVTKFERISIAEAVAVECGLRLSPASLSADWLNNAWHIKGDVWLTEDSDGAAVILRRTEDDGGYFDEEILTTNDFYRAVRNVEGITRGKNIS